MADALHKNAETIGSTNQDLVLNTFGRIYIRVRDRYYELNYGNSGSNNVSNKEKNDPDIIILESSNNLASITYPGDNKVVLTLDGGFYITINGEYRPYTIKQTGSSWEIEDLTVKNPIKILTTTESPFIINSKQLVENLNAQYLNGYTDDEFAKKAENESISGNWTIKNILFVDNVLRSTNKKNTLNDTVLDFANSTLDIDYINVRKAMRVYEYIINRIKCTNGSFWVSDSAIIQSISKLSYDESDVLSWAYTIVDAIQDDFSFGTLNNEWHTLEEWYNIFIPNYSTQPYVPIDIENKTQVNNATTLLTGRTPEGVITNETVWNKTKELYPIQYGELSILDFLDTLYNGFYNISGVSEKFNGSIKKYQMKDETSSQLTVFWINDVVRCQKIEGVAPYNAEGVVTKVEGLDVWIKFTDLSDVNIIEGDTFVRIDNVIHPDRRGAVYMTSADYKAPYIDVIDNTDYSYSKNDYDEDITDEPYINNSNIKIRLGRLDGLAYDEVFGRMSGMGIFIKGDYNQNYTPEATTLLGQIEEFAQNNSGGLYIKDGCIALGSYVNSDRKVGILLNNDGSGYLAQGHIYWNKNGTLYLDGGNNEGLIILNGDIKLGPNANGTYKIELKNDGSAKFGNGTTIFTPSGSGYLADGNIMWDVNNEVTIRNIDLIIGRRPAWLFSTNQTVWTSTWYSNCIYAKDINNKTIQIGGTITSSNNITFTFSCQYKTESNLTYRNFTNSNTDYIKASYVAIKVTTTQQGGTTTSKEYESTPKDGIKFNKDGSGYLNYGNFTWDNLGTTQSKTEILGYGAIQCNGETLYIRDNLHVDVMASVAQPKTRIVLPNDYRLMGKQVRLYVRYPATMNTDFVYVYQYSTHESNLIDQFSGGLGTGDSTVKIYTYECIPAYLTSSGDVNDVQWIKGTDPDATQSGVLYSGHVAIPTAITDPFTCILTKYGSMSGINVSSVKYQYALNPNMPNDLDLNNNWVGYIYHNIGHTNYTLNITTVPYEFWLNRPQSGQNVNNLVCRVIVKRPNECVFQINKTDGTKMFQEFDFILCGSK